MRGWQWALLVVTMFDCGSVSVSSAGGDADATGGDGTVGDAASEGDAGGDAPALLELDVNGNAYVWPTWISADSCVIYVTTTPGPGDFDPEHTDLYVAVRGR
jgi:hypothetical protein